MKSQFRGDTGKFLKALAATGFSTLDHWSGLRKIFNDVRKDRSTRRLKLWFAADVFNATQQKQQKLERMLKKEFGTRYLGGEFISNGNYLYDGKALCIKLTGF